jgi:DNA-binding NtrC family response regulator
MAILMEHHYPGNVRELRKYHRTGICTLPGDDHRQQHLPPELRAAGFVDTGSLNCMNLKTMEQFFDYRSLTAQSG